MNQGGFDNPLFVSTYSMQSNPMNSLDVHLCESNPPSSKIEFLSEIKRFGMEIG